MRSVLLLSFALLPVAATAQARSISAFVPETTMTAAISGMPAAAPAALAPAKVGGVHEVIRTVVDGSFVNPLLSDNAELESRFGEPSQSSAPKLTSYNALTVSNEELASHPDGIAVAVSLMVDYDGSPYDLHITQSAGKKIDEQALALVQTYRFAPATVDYRRVKAPVTVEVKIDQK